MVVYGRNPVREAIRGPREVSAVWASKNAAREPWLEGAPVSVVATDELERLSGSQDHQGICAEVSDYSYADAQELLAADTALVVALDEVQDPQNLGAICRVAECAGAAGLVIGERRSAQVTAAVCRASAGAVEHLRIGRVGNLADWLLSAKDAGAWVYGAAPITEAVPYDEPDYSGLVVLVLGAEGRGLRRRVASTCDQLVAIPLRGRIESLNVSAAAAVLMYEILHSAGGLDKGT